jgi:asparagine synthase (glutamine-hydrolysing)
MCGIFGVFSFGSMPINLERVRDATGSLRHRGPDDEGYLLAKAESHHVRPCAGRDTRPGLNLPQLETYRDESFDLALGFRRLSILDLSPAGHQPMASPDGRFWIIFNGEIYNYVEIRSELKSLGHRFLSGSDSEVILAAYLQWGARCIERFNGMWAFAIWDSVGKELFLARDRFGEKPLHYVYQPGNFFAFASEIKALHATGLIERRVHEETLSRFKYHNQTDVGEQTFYQDVFRLLPAHSLLIGKDGSLKKQRYWDIDPRIQEEGKAESWYAEQFRQIFFESVKLRLRSDVAVGSSLSGGLDSSTVVSVMDRLLPQGAVQKTFSARFSDEAKDEGKWIEQVTKVTRVEPHFVWPTGEEMFAELERLFYHQEEPFGSASIYAQWCVMRLAKEQNITVLLDGQGADETLAGYHPYFNIVADALFKGLKIPSFIAWRSSYRALHGKPLGTWSATVRSTVKQSVPRGLKQSVKTAMGRNDNSVDPFLPEYPKEFGKVSALRKILWWNTTRQGLVELLRYADRNSMAHSREVRLPFLDHHLVEFIFRLPDQMLIRDGWTKWILRQAFKGVVPDAILARVDKLGYEPPQERWLGRLTWKEVMLEQLGAQDSSLSGKK